MATVFLSKKRMRLTPISSVPWTFPLAKRAGNDLERLHVRVNMKRRGNRDVSLGVAVL